MLAKNQPRNRDEEEIAGYRDVLKLTHDSYEYINVVANDILTLHKYLYVYSAKEYKGKCKSCDNMITERDAKGNEHGHFILAPVYLTPDLIAKLCYQYNQAIQNAEVDPLLLILYFLLDFLSVCPFIDGNGRMSQLLMHNPGYLVGKYSNIEQLIEKSKETY